MLECTVSLLHNFEEAERWDKWIVGTHGIIANFQGPKCFQSSFRYLHWHWPHECVHIIWKLKVLYETLVLQHINHWSKGSILYSQASYCWQTRFYFHCFVQSPQQASTGVPLICQMLQAKKVGHRKKHCKRWWGREVTGANCRLSCPPSR